jgi:hypothetical protein
MNEIQYQRPDSQAARDVSGGHNRAGRFEPFGDVIDLINPLQHIPLLGGAIVN